MYRVMFRGYNIRNPVVFFSRGMCFKGSQQKGLD